MKTNVTKVTHLDSNSISQDRRSFLCLCKVLNPVLQLSRIFGLFPASWMHKNDRCVFTRSLFWLFYTIIITCLYVYQVVTTVDFLNLIQMKSLPIFLNDITNAIYGIFVVVLVLVNFARSPKWIKTLNEYLGIIRSGLFCQFAMRVAMLTQYGFVAMFLIIVLLKIVVLTWLHYSESYHTQFSGSIFVNQITQTIPFIFYIMFFTVISILVGTLACFEKLMISTLKYVPVHPMKGIDETNNEKDFMGIIHHKLCTGEHPTTPRIVKLSPPEKVEYLRILHEAISLCIYDFNSCMNPQFLLHTVVELAVLIIHCYAVIAYMAYNFKSPFARTIHVLNCLFVILHTVGLFLFLKNAQHLKNMIQGLTNFLLEYATRITTQEEHQQVRIFIEKLKHHRPLTASGVFTIDLGIAGPISANILTYVLVALQFEIPKE